ncbi:hypothetical protein FRB99_005350 [Tulasnella sp. 403]|nr:hypothetical protein FRB99_005350 [Tulasnella sp. 403]
MSSSSVAEKDRATLSSTLSRCHTLSKLLKDGGSVVPLVPLSAIGGIACVIIELVNDIRTLQGRCASLAEKAARIVVDLLAEAAKVAMSNEILEHITQIEDVLCRVKVFIEVLAKTRWYRKLWRKYEVECVIDGFEAELERHYNAFKDKVATSTHRTVVNMSEQQSRFQKELLGKQDEMLRLVKGMGHPPSEHESQLQSVDIIPYNQLELKREITSTSQRISFFRGTYIGGRDRDSTPVIVKKYPRGYQLARFIEEIQRYNRLVHVVHSNVPRLIGRSHTGAELLFAVIADYTGPDAGTYLTTEIAKSDVDGFMAGLSVMQGVAAALEFYRKDMLVGLTTLQECIKVPSLRLSKSGSVIVGQNVVASDSFLSDPIALYDLEMWLKDQFNDLTFQLLFGGVDAIKWDDWDSVRNTAPHVRPLITFVAYDCPTFTFMSKRLNTLLDWLEDLYHSRALTYRTIRARMLDSEKICQNLYWYPPKEVDAVIGDVGYVKDGRDFVKLCNVTGEVDFKVNRYEPELLRAGDYVTKDGQNGVVVHEFKDVQYAKVTRWDSYEYVETSTPLWRYLRDKAPEILAKYGAGHDIGATDLIIIGGVFGQRRFATFEFKGRTDPDAPSTPPPSVRFVEDTNAMEGDWGRWEWDNRGEYYVVTKIIRRLQRLDFAQLEKGDID